MAGEIAVDWVAIRGGMSGGSPIGEEQKIYFRQLDLAAKVRLPWEKEIGSGWVFGAKMLGSAGVLNGGNESNAVVTFLPLAFSLAQKDTLLSVDVGGGGAFLSDYKFGMQNFGGPFQFVWTFGADGAPLENKGLPEVLSELRGEVLRDLRDSRQAAHAAAAVRAQVAEQ